MKVKDILNEHMITFLNSTSKAEALRELIAVLCDNNIVTDAQTMHEQFLARESLMSTGIGLGIGVPHVRSNVVTAPIVAVGLSPEGINDYASLDNQPVRIICMIIVPLGAHKLYIELLSQVATVLKNEQFRNMILAETKIATIYKKLYEAFSPIF